MALSGVTPQVISNAYIERTLNLCDPEQAYAFSIKISGHSLYVIALKDLGISLVYDFAQQGWTYWTSTVNNRETYFTSYFYNSYNGLDLLQHESNGKVYIMDTESYQDDGNPITVLARTPLIDFGNNVRKFFSQLQVIGDKVASYAKVRYTNDD